jgi:hypothetical protein
MGFTVVTYYDCLTSISVESTDLMQCNYDKQSQVHRQLIYRANP